MQLNEMATFNGERWNALVEAGIEYSRHDNKGQNRYNVILGLKFYL